MSLRDDGDFTSHFLTARQRDLEPLVRESEEALHLDPDQTLGMQAFLDRAWLSGTHACQVQLTAETPDVAQPTSVDTHRLEADFKALMDESAEALNLTVTKTVSMWNFLGRACIAGIHSCRAEITAQLFETNTDVGAEALRWLERRGELG